MAGSRSPEDGGRGGGPPGGSRWAEPVTDRDQPAWLLRQRGGAAGRAGYCAAGVLVSLSVDTTALAGNADMFATMRATQNIENARSGSEFALPPRRVVELATISGARDLGIADRVGSLTPGKRADLILMRTTDVNIGPFTNPAHLLVGAAQPANVDTVIVDGRILKRRGQLTPLDGERVVREAAASLAGVRARAGGR